ncbi:MAG TPA: hypothetical protein DC013_03725 [Ruminococcaceae bacterium]|jgi:hypothetical protein|nr:hypothetical protein [Oscillospiraceae bacterium]
MINELNFPVVLENGREIAYGGDQDWFPQKFQQNAGCASTTGANLAAYYAKNDPKCARFYRGNTGRFLKTEYLDCMQELYRYMTPGFMGFPLVNRFARKFVQFAGEHGGVSVRPHILCRENRPGERIRFVKQAIGGGNPVALLILRHRAPELEEDNWHWVTVTGWIEDAAGDSVIFSDCGKRDIHPMNVVFEPRSENVLRMAWFSC